MKIFLTLNRVLCQVSEEQAEEQADQILSMIMTCKTDSEILEKLLFPLTKR